jgi:hypothetical protein
MGWYEYKQKELEEEANAFDLAELAEAVGGEIDGIWVRCASPGMDDDDRSCFVKFYSATRFWIYECVGKKGKAYAAIRAKLGITEAAASSRPDRSELIERILKETQVGRGTAVEHYLRAREIMIEVPYCLNFHPRLFHSPSGKFFPAMVAERQNVFGEHVAIHRTYLAWERAAKAPVSEVRMDLGPAKGTAIRLSPLAEELLVGEGIETVLSAIQATGKPGWAAGGLLRDLLLPPEVRRVVILADGDAPGERAATAAATRWIREKREVRIARAPSGKDFNDLLMEGRNEHR